MLTGWCRRHADKWLRVYKGSQCITALLSCRAEGLRLLCSLRIVCSIKHLLIEGADAHVDVCGVWIQSCTQTVSILWRHRLSVPFQELLISEMRTLPSYLGVQIWSKNQLSSLDFIAFLHFSVPLLGYLSQLSPPSPCSSLLLWRIYTNYLQGTIHPKIKNQYSVLLSV